MRVSHSLLLLVTLINVTLGSAPEKTEVMNTPARKIIFSCHNAAAKYKWGYNATAGPGSTYYGPMCNYDPYLASILSCAADKFNPYSKSFSKTLKKLGEYCTLYGGAEEESATFDYYTKVYENGTKYIVKPNATTNYTITKLYRPMRFNLTKIVNPSYEMYGSIYYNFDIGSLFAGYIYLYFLFIFIIFGVGNLIKRLGYHRRFSNRYINWYRANISIPALGNGSHTDYYSFFKYITTLVPTRVESLVVFFYICLNVLLTTVNYDVSQPYSLTKPQLLYEDIADRTGLLAFAQIPLLIMFAGRNNLITSLTGIPYSSLIVYHKWSARIMWIHAVIHSGCWTGYALTRNYLKYYLTETYWRWGIVATVLGGVIMIPAFHAIRSMSYEVFLVTHIILVVMFIVGCWYHCVTLGWLEWLYVSWSFWIADRISRVIRMSLFGIQKAEVKYVGDDTFRVEVAHNKWFDPFPGSFAYLYFMTPTLFWQSHPFTLMKSINKENHICFYIKAKAGITKRILKQLKGGSKTMNVCVEGPYGHRAPMEKYSKALFLAGGNGIPGIFAHVYDLCTREASNKQEVKFLWVVRNLESLSWFADELRAMASYPQVQMDIYITGHQQSHLQSDEKLQSNGSNTSNSDIDEKKESTSSETNSDIENKSSIISSQVGPEDLIKQLSDRVTFHYHTRPNIDELILNEFTKDESLNLSPSASSVAVMSCGPPKMCDEIRTSVANHLQKCKGRVDIFEELQVW